MELTPAQQRAVTHRGVDVCVVAGPGSGKTRVLVERFAWLVSEGLAAPEAILTITFTERAANEIKRRLAERFKDDAARRSEIERAPVSTVHGFCTKLLKEHAISAGLDPEFHVLDERIATLMLRSSIDTVLDQLLAADPDRLRDLYDSWAVSNPIEALAEVYEAVRLTGGEGPTSPPPTLETVIENLRAALARNPPSDTPTRRRVVDGLREWLARAKHAATPAQLDTEIADLRHYKGPLKEAIQQARPMLVSIQNAARLQTLDFLLREIHQSYADAKSAASALDFNDLEAFSIQMLTRDIRLRESVQRRFDYILMDELQDTNPLQWRLVELIRRENRFFAVGDINQAIYGFRHATPEAFRLFRERATREGAVEYLRDNFRSRPGIVAAACEVTAAQEGIENPDLHAARIFASKDDVPVERIVVEPETSEDVADLEAQAVCSRILELVGNFAIETRDGSRLATFRDIAILFRTSNRYAAFETCLQDLRIPYVLTSGRAFFERQEIFDCINWLRVLANPRDEIALFGILRSPLIGVSDEALLRMRRHGEPLIESVRANDEPRLVEFIRLLDECRRQMDDVSPDRLLASVLDKSNYEAGLDSTGRANVRKLRSLARDWFIERPASIASLVEFLDGLKAAGGDEPNALANDSADAVQLMTVHGAKGLEFPIVFFAGLDLRPQVDSTAFCFSPATGLGAKWRRGTEELADAAAARYKELIRQREREEASRLLYVGLTRAEQKLILSHGVSKSGWAALVEKIPVTQVVAAPRKLKKRASELAIADQDEFVDPPSLGEQFDSAATATDLAMFAQCPRRYLLDRYIGWQQRVATDVSADGDLPAANDDELSASETGRMVHGLLAGQELNGVTAEAKQLAEVFQSSALAKRALDAARVEREFPFIAELEGLIVNGQIDLWFEDSEGVVLVDYKTDHATADEARARARPYSVQLSIYAAVLARLAGRAPDRAVLHFLRPDTVVDVNIASDVNDKVKELIREFRRSQQSMDFPLREAPHCKRCPHWRSACPSRFGQEQLGLFDSGG